MSLGAAIRCNLYTCHVWWSLYTFITAWVTVFNFQAFWEEYDVYTLAKSYFDLKEFDRAHHTLRNCSSPKPYFLRMYSLYMADQKKKADNMPDSNGNFKTLF